MRVAAALAAAVAAVATAGCMLGDDDDAFFDVDPAARECFAGGMPEGAGLAGEVELGLNTDFTPIEPEQDVPVIEPVGQGSAMFLIHPRMRGLSPGDPTRNASPENPLTLLTAWGEDGERLEGTKCGSRLAYRREVEGEGGDVYDLGYTRHLPLSGLIGQDDLDGERVLLRVEVLDYGGRYASAEAWVRAVWTFE